MFRTHTEPLSMLKAAMTEIEEAREFFDRAEGNEQIDEATTRLIAAEMTANRIIREIKKERGLRIREYKFPLKPEKHFLYCQKEGLSYKRKKPATL